MKLWFGVASLHGSDVELGGIVRNRPEPDEAAQVLVMTDGGPSGWLEWAEGTFDDESACERALALPVVLRTPVEPAGSLSVVICTRDRPDSLARCLDRFRCTQAYDADVLVVDNAPRSPGNESVVDRARAGGMRVRRVVEERPGLSCARNRGLREAQSDFVAFTDDDVLIDPRWSAALRRGFARGPKVGLVTGLVPPAEVSTTAQAQFTRKMKWSRSLEPRLYSMRDRELYTWPFPYSAGHFGTGANFAVDRRLALDLGGFNERLGAGTRTAGGEDLEMFIRVLLAGSDLVYEPSAVTWHMHRTDETQLKKLMFGYGKGLTAVLLANLARGNRCRRPSREPPWRARPAPGTDG